MHPWPINYFVFEYTVSNEKLKDKFIKFKFINKFIVKKKMPVNWLEFSFNMIRRGEHLHIINDMWTKSCIQTDEQSDR